jgi:hypothetical protein
MAARLEGYRCATWRSFFALKGPASWFTGNVRIDPLNTAPARRETDRRNL